MENIVRISTSSQGLIVLHIGRNGKSYLKQKAVLWLLRGEMFCLSLSPQTTSGARLNIQSQKEMDSPETTPIYAKIEIRWPDIMHRKPVLCLFV